MVQALVKYADQYLAKGRRKRGFFIGISKYLQAYGYDKSKNQCKSHLQKLEPSYMSKIKTLKKTLIKQKPYNTPEPTKIKKKPECFFQETLTKKVKRQKPFELPPVIEESPIFEFDDFFKTETTYKKPNSLFEDQTLIAFEYDLTFSS